MDYFKNLSSALSRVEIIPVQAIDEAIREVVSVITAGSREGNKLIFIGNGGSASIASHMATDFLKNAGIAAVTFNDVSLLSCIANDLGYEYVFSKPIELVVRQGDIVFLISSSGQSKNIINASNVAKAKGCFLVTLSGFKKDNPLRKLGNINFYIPSNSYGYVEIAHLAICHSIVDAIIENKK